MKGACQGDGGKLKQQTVTPHRKMFKIESLSPASSVAFSLFFCLLLIKRWIAMVFCLMVSAVFGRKSEERAMFHPY